MPNHFEAVALGFSPTDLEGPPCVRFKGVFNVADTIVAVARRNGIPVVEQDELAAALVDVPLDSPIPKELFKAAAILLAKVGALYPATSASERVRKDGNRASLGNQR